MPQRVEAMGTAEPREEELRALVERIAASTRFQKSPRMRTLLLYICEHGLANRPDKIREPAIGVHVFGRAPDYNPNDDNIVRVSARELRRRLDEYFVGEGRDEPLLIEIPKGGYVPRFVPRSSADAPTPWAEAQAPPLHTPKAMISHAAGRWGRLAIGFGAGVLTCAAVISTVYLSRTAVTQPDHPLFSRIFKPGPPPLFVMADASLVLLQDIVKEPVSLAGYLTGDYIRRLQRPVGEDRALLFDLASGRRSIGYAEGVLGARLARMDPNLVLRVARDVTMADFRTTSLVVVGSKRSNPWVELFEPKLDFSIEYDEQRGQPFVRNRAPRAGELPIYPSPGDISAVHGTYGIIAFLPNLTHTGSVLILAGATMAGTEAAGELVLSPVLLRKLTERLGREHPLPYFEVLIKAGRLAGASGAVEIVVHRVLDL
jgi:hypothetical protein